MLKTLLLPFGFASVLQVIFLFKKKKVNFLENLIVFLRHLTCIVASFKNSNFETCFSF